MQIEKTRASVAMAVYNGEKYLGEQIDSILSMMSAEDELVISYDESTDRTWEIIKEYEQNDNRVKVVTDKKSGLENNFNNAVLNCSGKYIFLADQDDVWINDKIDKMVIYMEKHPSVVVAVGNGYISNSTLEVNGELFDLYNATANPIRNFVKGTYLGCQMAFSRTILNMVWPVSANPPVPHDLWLGVVGAKYGKIALIEEKTIIHRVHDRNYTNTSKLSLLGVIKNRIFFLRCIINRLKENKNENKG